MIGLLVIIILILVIIVIYIRISSAPSVSTKADTIADMQNEKLISSILDVTACQGKNFEDSIEACTRKEDICSQDSCDLVEEMADEMLEMVSFSQHFDLKDKRAHLTIKSRSGDLLFEKGYDKLKQECEGIRIPSNRTIFPNIGTVFIERCVR